MVSSLSNADVLYNTYWVRYKDKEGRYAHDLAVSNTRNLISAAEVAGIKRIVHFSVANPDKAPDWTYFIGKTEVEKMIVESKLSHAILRPTVFFGGKRDVLVNNMAWLIRCFPVFGVFGWGNYPVQPVHVEDVARISIEVGMKDENITLDVAGTEVYTYREFVTAIAKGMGVTRLIVPVPPVVGWVVGRIFGLILKDDVITMAEIRGLMQGLMASKEDSRGKFLFSEWISENGATLGLKYHNDLRERRYSIQN